MPGIEPTIPHFAFPFGRVGGKIATVEQDSPAHVLACENVIARCPLGSRIERPDFGWRWPYMRMLPLDTTDLINALKRFEPRGNPSILTLGTST
jgi:phage baseplate assembly protein W